MTDPYEIRQNSEYKIDKFVLQKSEEISIKVLSLNISALSAIFGLWEIKPDITSRARRIAFKILAMSDNVDIICLQETFDGTARDTITDILDSVYPYHYRDTANGAFLLGANSGLCIFSKHPIVKKVKHKYQFLTGDDYLSKKSTIGVKIKLPHFSEENKNSYIWIYNTHMQAGNKTEWYYKLLYLTRKNKFDGLDWSKLTTDQIRYMHLKENKKFIDETSENLPFIFVGDFNINAYDKNFFNDPLSEEQIKICEMINKVFPDSLILSQNSSLKIDNNLLCSYDNTIIQPSNYDDKRIDYVMSSGITGYSYIIGDFKQADTDHLGLIGEFIV